MRDCMCKSLGRTVRYAAETRGGIRYVRSIKRKLRKNRTRVEIARVMIFARPIFTSASVIYGACSTEVKILWMIEAGNAACHLSGAWPIGGYRRKCGVATCLGDRSCRMGRRTKRTGQRGKKDEIYV